MATFAQIKTAIATRLIEADATITAELGDLVNDAMREIQEDHNFQIMKAVSSLNLTTASSRTLLSNLPSNFKEFRGRPYRVSDGGHPTKMTVVASREQMFGDVGIEDLGAPKYLYVAENSGTEASPVNIVEVWPLPDGLSDWSGGEYRITIPYWKYATALSADGDTNWFTAYARLYLIYKATAMALPANWDETRALFWEQMAEEKRQQAIKRDKLQVLAQMDTLIPHWQGVETPWDIDI